MSPVYLYAQQEASLILTVQHGNTLCMNYSTEVCHLLFSKYTMQCTYITSDSPQGKKLFSWQQGRGAEARKNKVEKLQTNHQNFRKHLVPALCGFHQRCFHLCGFWLMYVLVGEVLVELLVQSHYCQHHRQCLLHSAVQLKSKHYQKPHYCNGVVDTVVP